MFGADIRKWCLPFFITGKDKFEQGESNSQAIEGAKPN